MFGQKEIRLILIIGSLTFPAFADTVHMKSGEMFQGAVETVNNQSVVITSNGKSQTLPRADVGSIDLSSTPSGNGAAGENFLTSMSKPESPYATPAMTFQTWRKAALAGDVSGMVKCYASFKQNEKKKELKKLSKDVFDKMRAATIQTDFAPSAPLYQGDRATMVVNWSKGMDGSEQILQFILEKNDWKILQ